MLEAQNVGLRRGRKWTLNEASLAVEPGQLVAICGPNGAGKSTLLRVLSGEESPSEGEIRWDKLPARTLSAGALARRRAVLPQEVSVPFPYAVHVVVELGRLPWGDETSAEGLAIARSALEDVGAGALANRTFNTLSGGEQKRVQLARVLAQAWPRPSGDRGALFLDEPTASLDAFHQHQTLAIARQWADAGAAVIVVEHDLNLARQYATDVVLMRSGRIFAQGPAQTVLNPQTIGAVFDVEVIEAHSAALRQSVFVTRPPTFA